MKISEIAKKSTMRAKTADEAVYAFAAIRELEKENFKQAHKLSVDLHNKLGTLPRCNDLIELYWKTGQYEQCFRGHLHLAEKGYPLAECQVGYFYLEGIGVQKNLEKAFYWTERAAQHGDRDAQFNLGWFYENGIVVPKELKWAERWYVRAASQRQKEALEKIKKIK